MSDWRSKLKEIMEKKREASLPPSRGLSKALRQKKMDLFFRETVVPAFEELKKGIEENNGDVEVHVERETYQASIVINRRDRMEFFYTIRECRYHGKYFAFPQIVKPGESKVPKAEVITPQKRHPAKDIEEFTKEGIIDDFLSAYEKYA